MRIAVTKLTPEAKLPTYAHATDAGMDVYAATDVIVPAHERTLVPTGVAMAIPEGYVGLIWDKSGIATKRGLTTLAGVIDAGYRGELQVAIYNTTAEDVSFAAGEKVAQMLVQPVVQPELQEVEALEESERGANGFGSTGVI